MSQKNIGFNLNYDEKKGMSCNLNLPPEPEIARFATVLRPLADPSSEIYFKNIISILTSTVTSSEKESLDKVVKRIDSGPIKLKVNDKLYSALDLYLIYSKGEYFDEDKEALKELEGLKNNPMMPNYITHQFYNYSYDVYKLCKDLYGLIRRAESKSTAVKSTSNQKNKCIYCLTEEGNFTSQEHVYPESLGNNEIILPPGHVCDKCNNEVLSHLDLELVESDIISYLRFQFVPYNPKTGEFLKVKFKDVTMEKTHPRKIVIKPTDSRSKKKFFHEKKTGDEVNINFKPTGRRNFNHQLLGRSLYKIALGIVCWQLGPKKALDEKYNPARDFIMGKRDFPNYFVLPKNCTVTPTIEGEFVFRNPGTFFTISIFGAAFFFNLEPGPIIKMNKQMEKAGLQCFSLSDNYKEDPSSAKKFGVSFEFSE